MAFWDDPDRLINFVRHGFITSDDTTMCESIFMPAETSKKPGCVHVSASTSGQSSPSEADDDPSEHLRHSPDIQMDYGHRRRSNTSRRLEVLRSQKVAQSQVRNVHWKAPDKNEVKNYAEIFKAEPIEAKSSTSAQSLLARLIKEDVPSTNPFQHYARYDGSTSFFPSVKKVRVFLPMLSDVDQRHIPLPVAVDSTAKVSDLIGLTCYLYVKQNKDPPLSVFDVSAFSLFMAEDTGEIDDDLPPLDAKEVVGKFGFPTLALVQTQKVLPQKHISTPVNSDYHVKIQFDDGETHEELVSSLDTPIKELQPRVLRKHFSQRNVPPYQQLDYDIERLSEPGTPLSPELSVRTAGFDLYFVRKNSVRGRSDLPKAPQRAISPTPSDRHSYVEGMAVCHFYTVLWVHRLKPSTSVQLGICSDRLEIIPLNRRISATERIFQPLAKHQHQLLVYPIEKIAGCDIAESQKNGKCIFRIILKTGVVPEWKMHHFEGTSDKCDEIVRNLTTFLDRRNSDVRKEYLSGKTNAVLPRKTSVLKRLQSFDFTGTGTA